MHPPSPLKRSTNLLRLSVYVKMTPLANWFFRNVVYRAAVLVRGEYGVYDALDELRALENQDPDAVRRRTRDKLKRTLSYAFEQCDQYRETWPGPLDAGEDPADYLRRLPVVEKADLRVRTEALGAASYNGRTMRKTTGGSTGEAVTVLKNPDAIAREMAASWLGYGWFGIRIGDRAARFWGTPSSTKRKLRSRAADLAMHRIRFSAFAFDENDLERYWERCNRFSPAYLYGYVSMLVSLAQFVRDRCIDAEALDLKAVVTTSEVLTPPDRRLLEETFGCPVQNEYGCGEVGPIAYSCPEGSLHVMCDNVYVEVLNRDGEPAKPGEAGSILVTDLNNRAMPLVRYRVGDHGVRGGTCPCGRPFPVLQKIWGRSYDFVVDGEGRHFHGEYFMYLFEELREREMDIQRFQVRQVDRSRLEIDLVTNGINGAPERFLTERIRRDLAEVKPVVRQVESIPRTRSGKHRLIVNEHLQAS